MDKSQIDNNLIRKVLHGDESYLKLFVDICMPIIWGALARFNQLSKEDREDIQQNIFVKLFAYDMKVIRAFKGDSAFSSYLWMITSRESLDYIRKKYFKDISDLDKIYSSLGVKDHDQETWISLLLAIEKTLTEIEKNIIEMYMEGYLEREISEKLKLPIGTVSSYKKRAFDKIKIFLKEK